MAESLIYLATNDPEMRRVVAQLVTEKNDLGAEVERLNTVINNLQLEIRLGVQAFNREKRHAAQLQDAIKWVLGTGESFPERKDGEGAYWWRPELQRRAGLWWDGEKYIPFQRGGTS